MHELIEELEREARDRSRTLENDGRLTGGFTSFFYPLTTSDERERQRLHASLMLARDADTFVALARGFPVPRRRIRTVYLRTAERWSQ